jgi:hypothetical protein
MAKKYENLELRIKELEALISKKQYVITFIAGGILLRDKLTQEVQLIDSLDDDFEEFQDRWTIFLDFNTLCLTPWSEIESSPYFPEFQWFYNYISPGLSTRKAWAFDRKMYRKWCRESKQLSESFAQADTELKAPDTEYRTAGGNGYLNEKNNILTEEFENERIGNIRDKLMREFS